MQKILRELDIDNFDSIQNKLIPYLLVKYPGLYQFWNHVDQTDLFEQIPELLTTIQDIFAQSPLKTYLLVIPNAPEHMVAAKLGAASIHKDTSIESCRLNWPILNGTSIETRMFNTTGDPVKILLPTGETYLTYAQDQCEQIASFYLTKPTIMHVHTAHGLYRAVGPLPRYVLSFNFEQDISHLLT